eukprot:15443688-Alexandrium_andersonii.AAC.1
MPRCHHHLSCLREAISPGRLCAALHLNCQGLEDVHRRPCPVWLVACELLWPPSRQHATTRKELRREEDDKQQHTR